MSAPPFIADVEVPEAQPVARFRILYADTDKMGIAYHAAFLRYMELGRVELLRSLGVPYTDLERFGLALPLSDLAVRYRVPARYDDEISIYVGLVLVTRVRVHFQYRFVIEPGGRPDVDERLILLVAETRHACVRVADAKPERMPPPFFERLEQARDRLRERR